MMRSIFNRLLLSHIIVMLVSFIALGLMMSYLVRSYVVDSKRQDLLTKGTAAVAMVNPILASGKVPTDIFLQSMSDMAGATLWIMDEDGDLIAGHMPERWTPRQLGSINELREIATQYSGTAQIFMRPNRAHADPAIVLALPIPAAAQASTLFMYVPLTGVTKISDAVETLLLYALLVGVIIAILFGLILSRSLTRPVADISRAAAAFAKGDYSSRTTATGGDEIGDLGRTFNSMADDLAKTEQNRRDFLANVTHELKTPITSIQALAEAILDGLATQPGQQQRYLNTIVGECGRIERMVHDLLDLSQLEAGELSIHLETLDAVAFIRNIAARQSPLLTEKKLALELDLLVPELPIHADFDRLAQILDNLITNAVRHAPASSTIRLTAQKHASTAEFVISDQGPGIPESDLPHIWERFYRGDKSRARAYGGAGLGLPIVKKLVQAMGGEIGVTNGQDSGAIFTFTLPLAK
ncbi:MAG TPA: HAMP domain-containing sensor histidine kinase [Patescibacteria group bacterium]|nr:HAMP domain-containing sensor histidine kinase [Patescibacteria group bacterium]